MTNHLFDIISTSMPRHERVFAFLEDGTPVSYQDVLDASAQYANVLKALGVAVGDRQDRLMRSIHIIGIGAGDPDYVTAQAVRALNDARVFFVADKGEAKSDLVALRREVLRRFVDEPGYRFVELPDPQRAADGDYTSAVTDWHAARAQSWAQGAGWTT